MGVLGCWARSHLMRATLWQVLNVPNLPSTVHTLCTATGCSIGVEVCRQTTVAADKGTWAVVVHRTVQCEEEQWGGRNARSTCPSLPPSPGPQPTRNRPQIAPWPRPAPERGKDRGILEESAWVRLSWINENPVWNCYSFNCAGSWPN